MTTVNQPPGGGTDDQHQGHGRSHDQRDGRNDFEASYGESLGSILDVTTWQTGTDIGAMYEQLTVEVTAALHQESRVRNPIRQAVFSNIRARHLVRGAGVYRATPAELLRVHEGLLMTGTVEACDATRHAHETLPLTVTQIGVSLVKCTRGISAPGSSDCTGVRSARRCQTRSTRRWRCWRGATVGKALGARPNRRSRVG